MTSGAPRRKMSVVHRLSPGWLLDHLSFINKINYQVHQHHEPSCSKNKPMLDHSDSPHMHSMFPETSAKLACDSIMKAENEDRGHCEKTIQNYVFRSELFNVTKPYITAAVPKECQLSDEKEDLISDVKREISASIIGKKHKRCTAFNQGELDAMEYHAEIRELILDGSLQLIQEGLKSGFLFPRAESEHTRPEAGPGPREACSLSGLCELAKHLPSLKESGLQSLRLTEEDVSARDQDLFLRVVENNSSTSKMITLMGQKYLLPPKSRFLLSDISCMQPLLDCCKTFDVIVIDPPWQNKSVKRSNSSLSPLQIKQIPVPKLAAPDCLVVTWVTNRAKHVRFAKEELYPSWSVELLAQWHWVKITNSGEFVFPLDSPHKKPYEGLILGRVRGKNASPLRGSEVKLLPIPDRQLLVSVPCVLHSHKPPLAEVLKDYIRPGGECLELFARNLQPGWTSWGNEVLKFQHVDYFVAEQPGH
uniref:N(6)-adenine-specific methyltransferase METTL4 isoform X2 n=1 Tax=Jaculus jaculus TaxID=51337 RepID=UPI001E1B1A10|nr:N(6)-adenine-specific methyltransferase METTL4 isoform X2 [Jaculus jaculus]